MTYFTDEPLQQFERLMMEPPHFYLDEADEQDDKGGKDKPRHPSYKKNAGGELNCTTHRKVK